MVTIELVETGSLAEKVGIISGDILVSINGNNICDVLDYRFYLTESNVDLVLLRTGKQFNVKIVKGEYEDIGLEFETPLMDKKKTCKNKCIFCFIDQMPKGMRETLYFKDDDERLSFLHGNYITLTNLSESDIDRIIKMHLSPVNISVHTTDPELRVKMMKNKNAGKVLQYIPKLAAAGIELNLQIVLCKGINDGEALRKSLNDLSSIRPRVHSVSIVPAGLTDHRDGLYPLKPFSSTECENVIDTINPFGDKMKAEFGERVFYPSDEFYLTSGRELPSEDFYEGYPQLENGVGMSTLFLADAMYEIDNMSSGDFELSAKRNVSIATGYAAYPLLKIIVEKLMEKCYNLSCNVYPVTNRTFGKNITVSGLLTGKDIAYELKGKELGDLLLFPGNALRAGEEDFLCGMLPSELSEILGCSVKPCAGGSDIVWDIIGKVKY